MKRDQPKSERRSQKTATNDRHRDLVARLIEAAAAVIARSGLQALRARDLAEVAGCSVGAIYTVFPTLDALVLGVNDRTLSMFQAVIEGAPHPEAPDAQLAGFAAAYLAFAAQNRHLWVALFDHQLPAGDPITPEYAARQTAIFARIGEPIARLCPGLPAQALPLATRTVFSAVHGIVRLGLEEKLGTLPIPLLETHLRFAVETIAKGLQAQRHFPG